MHVNILTKVCDQNQGDCDKHKLPHRGTHVSTKLCIGSGADMHSQMDINSYTDACTHSNQVV